jgi:hypothetical protein
MVPCIVVEIRQFWTEKWTKVLSSFFPITHVPFMEKKKNKIEGAKNKNFKPHGSKIYLTLNLNDRQGI